MSNDTITSLLDFLNTTEFNPKLSDSDLDRLKNFACWMAAECTASGWAEGIVEGRKEGAAMAALENMTGSK